MKNCHFDVSPVNFSGSDPDSENNALTLGALSEHLHLQDIPMMFNGS